MNSTGPTSGPKPSRYFACPVTETVAKDRPWKLPLVDTMVVRSGCFATSA